MDEDERLRLHRERVNAAIAQEDAMVRGLRKLLADQRPLAEWPTDWVIALAGAIAHGSDSIENDKATRLRSHLFLDHTPIKPSPEDHRTRAAERLRADLADLVPYGAGAYLAG